ncbi:HD domain-containing phosphohydrolase [Alienimonas californiensis]|uniref:HD domain-containing phosphohydrolase n=1 Tax=Alienimonas californiensis TaxID=2527989 RepID=UPI0011A21CC0|nr:HD domain-containing phosphohydrolase [Alienimonas californiensis]
MPDAPVAPTVRFDLPAPHGAPAPIGGDVRSVAAALCALLGDPLLGDRAMRGWADGLRALAQRLAAAGLKGAIPPAEVRRIGGIVRAAAAARAQRERFLRWTADLGPALSELAVADHKAGARLLALTRGILAETQDFAAGSLPPTALLAAPPSGRTERGVAGACLAAWAATHYRPLWGEAEAVVLAALARDVGELTPIAVAGSPRPNARRVDRPSGPAANHAARSAALLTVCDRLPPAAARCAARHHERPDGGGGPAGLTAADLAPADRLLGWVDRFLALLPAPTDGTADAPPDPAAAWQACWQSAAAATYAAARRGELCLSITAAGIEALGLSRGEQGAADAAGVGPVGLALTDLGRTRLRLDAGHALAAPRFAAAARRAAASPAERRGAA